MLTKSKKNQPDENYLEKIPIISTWLTWSQDEKGLVTLDIENKGIMKKITQVLLKKPKVSHIHLDKIGSFIWLLIDGEKRISDFGEPMEEHFGDEAKPTYERLAKFFQVLESYGFVEWK